MSEHNGIEDVSALIAEQLFPQRRDDIRRLRRDNSDFDEICRDYELLARMLRDGSFTDAAMIESAEGLIDEIQAALMQNRVDP